MGAVKPALKDKKETQWTLTAWKILRSEGQPALGQCRSYWAQLIGTQMMLCVYQLSTESQGRSCFEPTNCSIGQQWIQENRAGSNTQSRETTSHRT